MIDACTRHAFVESRGTQSFTVCGRGQDAECGVAVLCCHVRARTSLTWQHCSARHVAPLYVSQREKQAEQRCIVAAWNAIPRRLLARYRNRVDGLRNLAISPDVRRCSNKAKLPVPVELAHVENIEHYHRYKRDDDDVEHKVRLFGILFSFIVRILSLYSSRVQRNNKCAQKLACNVYISILMMRKVRNLYMRDFSDIIAYSTVRRTFGLSFVSIFFSLTVKRVVFWEITSVKAIERWINKWIKTYVLILWFYIKAIEMFDSLLETSISNYI